MGEEGRERIVIFQWGVRVRMLVMRQRPREEAPPAIATVGIVSGGFWGAGLIVEWGVGGGGDWKARG